MDGKQWAMRETLEDPEQVRKSRDDPNTVKLYYRRYSGTEASSKFTCVIVKFMENDAFILTAYETYRIMPGELIWQKES